MYSIIITIGYLLMLIGMSYDIWLMLSIGAGTGIGHYFFNSHHVMKMLGKMDMDPCCQA
jgi:hypothetical protein